MRDWLLALGLTTVAAICQVFVVARSSTTGQRSDHLTLAPMFAAVLLLPRPLLALMLVITYLPEWYFHRRSWFGQIFNISQVLITAAITDTSLRLLIGHDRLLDSTLLFSISGLRLALAIPIFQLTQALMLAWVLKLARGQSFRTSGLFTTQSLLLEGCLTCIGLVFAVCWLLNPLYGLITAIPLVLIFQALHVPNLKEEAASDPKTGLANMRHFNEIMQRDIERVSRNGQPLSLLICDLDYLRNINNTYGHQAGDVVLLGIADILRRHIRSSDVAARFGGEEFVVLLSDTDTEGARAVAERIRLDLEQSRFEIGCADGPIGATLSIGVASFPRDGRTIEQMMRAADLAVYQAKRDGRNRVVVAGHESRALAGEWAREYLVAAEIPTTIAYDETPRPFWNFIQSATRASHTTGARLTPKITRVSGEESTLVSGPNPRRRWLTLSGALVAVGLLSLWLCASDNSMAWSSLALFGALTAIVVQFAIDNLGRGKITVAAVPILAATFLHHEAGILVTVLALTISQAIKSRGPLYHWLFNFGTLLLAGLGAHLVFGLFVSDPLATADLSHLILPAIIAGLVYHAINQVLICVIRGQLESRRPIEIWQEEYRWLSPHYVVLSALAVVLALSYLSFGTLGVLVLMAPVGMMHVAFKQYMDRTKVHVKELQTMNERLTDSYEATLQALTRALDTRDEETEEHSQRVKRYSQLTAQRMRLSAKEIEDIGRGALLHDIGKIGVPDAILLKPGRLTEEERALMRKHPEIGYRMIAHIPFLAEAAQVVLHHHEAFDGTGYPSRLSGNNIPLGARIFAVADAFDALTSDRPYRKALRVELAIAEIERCSGTQFDPQIVEAFLAIPQAELAAVHGVAQPMPKPAVAELPTEGLALAVET
ncbi:MAG: diguanylate cyclase [Chloroflexi bacterium]|nr:diguanylate cyclase [Chloroflexota bacterium]